MISPTNDSFNANESANVNDTANLNDSANLNHSSDSPPGLVIVLAAGEGTRMKSSTPKVLHRVLGKPIVAHVLDAVAGTNPTSVVVVVGHQRERVAAYLSEAFAHVFVVVQDEQNGTGHAVRCALQGAAAQGVTVGDGPIAVLAGDTPLLTTATLRRLLATHSAAAAAVTVLSANLPDATGYGRIVRDQDGLVTGIVEHKDASAAQLAITEVNSGMFAFEAEALQDALGRLNTDNSQGEEYLTDVLGIAQAAGRRVTASIAPDADEVHGVNDRLQLANAAAILRDRINRHYLLSGVAILDPATTWIESGAAIEPDAIIERNCYITADCSIAADAVIGPDTTLVRSSVGAGATVKRSQCNGATIGAGADVGPFSFLRPGAVLAEKSKVGAFVEVKNSTLGVGSKVPHLSYVGDAQIGVGSNIGAATIFANYDGVAKHRTIVGDHVRVGSDSMLVAPVEIGDGAYTAAGSVVTGNVPPGAIAISRAPQRNLDGWVEKKRPGTKSAQAARQARVEAAAALRTDDPSAKDAVSPEGQ